MSAKWKNHMSLILMAVLASGSIIAALLQPVRAAREAVADSGPRYSVIDTEGHNLIVTDNQTSTLYFYAIEKDKEIGSELKLRGTINLSQVGKPAIKLNKAKAE
jgi:hypothetical protein